MKYIVIELKTIDLAVHKCTDDETLSDRILTRLLNLGFEAYYSESYNLVLSNYNEDSINWFCKEGY